MHVMHEDFPGMGWYDQGGDIGAFALTFPAGFDAEGPEWPGLAHFTEHMLMAPRDRRGSPYAELESAGFLLEARTRRDHLTVTVCGPQERLLSAIGTLVAHIADLDRPDGTARQQAEIIRNEILEKTNLAPWADPWRWSIPAPWGRTGVDHDPIVAPALRDLAVHEGAWKGFAAHHADLGRSRAAIVADPDRVPLAKVAAILDSGPRRGPVVSGLGTGAASTSHAAADSAPSREQCGEDCRNDARNEIVLPVLADDLAGQSCALIAAAAVAGAVATLRGLPWIEPRYGLFGEWFSENGPTVLSIPVPSETDAADLEHHRHLLLEAATEPRSLISARERLAVKWAKHMESPTARARSTAWMLLGGRAGVAFADIDQDAVRRVVAEAAVLKEA